MANYLQVARRYAKRYGIDPGYFGNQMTQEAHGEDLTSPAGAQGPAQIMPGTAKSWGVRNVHDINQAYDAAAKHMAMYLHSFGGDWAKALTAYNAGPGAVGGKLPAETQAYIRAILKGGSPRQAPGSSVLSGGSSVSSGADSTALAGLQSQLADAQRQQSIGGLLHSNLLDQANVLNKQLGYGAQIEQPDVPDNSGDVANLQSAIRAMGQTSGRSTPPVADTSVRMPTGSQQGHVVIGPNAMKPGTKLAPELMDYLNELSSLGGRTITVGTGTNHNYLTVNGRVSDHADGHASDIPVPIDSSLGDRTAMRALEIAGVPPKQAAQMARQGGLYTIVPKSGPFKGKRVQVIWKTYEGGNHHNHVHVGIR